MILYVCSYVLRKPFFSEKRVDLKEIGWEKLSNIVKKVFSCGGSIIIHKTDADYSEESERLVYSDINSYSMVCDSRYGYLFGCSISENEEYPAGTYLRLVNRKTKNPDEIYIFEPHEDEWKAKYVNQDLELALNLFKDIYEYGDLLEDSNIMLE
ncbi:hypothetical protein J7S89_03760 [Acinetobacter baumannii]|jgi:hypothetical protein|uniref:Uncharacterized protein n=7 Tax=Acinetobacter baumannii TaxID=470 RepID=A0A1E3M703_ACIBA|nr:MULTISPECIES: hypothetical protein [Acinetobacter]EYD50793.1 hypothetical protein J917_2450 [Acinetobacter baumannii 25493_4]EYS13018.1 hypothetical protein K013_2587 [Acinetobacter baumannii 25569_7]ABS90158.1 hypothetical protein A1S_3733 [Acinetobacter baumannii ATCC 17978]AKQ26821.1 hypothetical protein ACX60_08780 [Acinetobacter baumannii]APP32419.1 hypothetical protein AUO97_16885 [Acinetobacter baumannii]